MKLQSQLAKAVKKMDATSQQMTLLEQSCDEVVASLKNEISDIVEERCRTELDLRRQLEQLEDQRSELKAAYEERIRENRREIERLKQRAQTEGAPDDVYKELEEAEHRLLELSLPQESGTMANQPNEMSLPQENGSTANHPNEISLPQENESIVNQPDLKDGNEETSAELSSPDYTEGGDEKCDSKENV
jgi:chromosome segregation ATPase